VSRKYPPLWHLHFYCPCSERSVLTFAGYKVSTTGVCSEYVTCDRCRRQWLVSWTNDDLIRPALTERVAVQKKRPGNKRGRRRRQSSLFDDLDVNDGTNPSALDGGF